MASAWLARGHIVHVIVFGVPMVTLVGAIALQEIRGRRSGSQRMPLRFDGRSPDLRAAAAGLLAAGAVHAIVIPEHFHEYFAYGVFFSVLTALQIWLAVVLTVRPSSRLVRFVAVGSAWVVVLYVVSRTSGLPIGPEPWHAESLGKLDLAATCAEFITLIGCSMQLWTVTAPGRRLARFHELTR
jgi:hypothetical protein